MSADVPAGFFDSLPLVVQVNYLGHFLLTELLLPALRAAPAARVINVASGASGSACKWASAASDCLDLPQLPPPVRAAGLNSIGAPTSNYGLTKFLQIYHARELAAREAAAGSKVRAFSMEPGFVDTPMTRQLPAKTRKEWCRMQTHCPLTAAEGASTLAFLVSSADAALPASADGQYFATCTVAVPSPWSAGNQKQLFDLSGGWAKH